MDLAEERQQMVLAEAEELDILHHHHLVEGHGEESTIHDLRQAGPIAAGEILHGALPALGGVNEALAQGVFAEQAQHLLHAGGNLAAFLRYHFYRGFLSHVAFSLISSPTRTCSWRFPRCARG